MLELVLARVQARARVLAPVRVLARELELVLAPVRVLALELVLAQVRVQVQHRRRVVMMLSLLAQ